MAPNSGGSPRRPIGISRSHVANAASRVVPRSVAAWSASSSTRAVRVYPGITLFTVMPSGATSFASVRAKPVTAARMLFDRIQIVDRLLDGDRRDVDDPPPPPLAHPRQHSAHELHHAHEVGAHGRVPRLTRVRLEPTRGRAAVVGDENIHASELTLGGRQHGGDAGLRRDVGDDVHNPDASRASDVRGCRAECRFTARAEHEIDSLGRERLGTCASEAAAGRGDERDFPANAEIHRYFFAVVWK